MIRPEDPAMSFPESPDAADAPLESALRASRALVDAPEHVILRAIALWPADSAARAAPAPSGGSRRLLAVLGFDSGAASPLAFGMRSSGGSVRQLLFSVEGRDIDLRIAPAGSDGRFALSGQILGPDSVGAVTVEPAAGGARAEAPLNELGEFVLPPVAPGQYLLRLELADMVVDLPPLDVPHPPAGGAPA